MLTLSFSQFLFEILEVQDYMCFMTCELRFFVVGDHICIMCKTLGIPLFTFMKKKLTSNFNYYKYGKRGVGVTEMQLMMKKRVP
jgi:hypothetical protein